MLSKAPWINLEILNHSGWVAGWLDLFWSKANLSITGVKVEVEAEIGNDMRILAYCSNIFQDIQYSKMNITFCHQWMHSLFDNIQLPIDLIQ